MGRGFESRRGHWESLSNSRGFLVLHVGDGRRVCSLLRGPRCELIMDRAAGQLFGQFLWNVLAILNANYAGIDSDGIAGIYREPRVTPKAH